MAEFLGTLERGQTATDEDMVPARAILIENQDRLSCGTDSSTGSRSLNLHERDEAMNFRLVRNKTRENSAEAERIFAERRAHPVFAGGGGVAFVEDEVDHFENGRQTRSKIRPAWDLKGNARLSQRAFGADDALGNGRLRSEKGARDFLGGQAAHQAKRERNARFRGKNRMTGDEHETQQIVADIVVIRGVEIRHSHFLLGLELSTE